MMRKVLSLSKFARETGFPPGERKGFKKHLKKLLSEGLIEIQQGGFLADNLHHHKLVIIKDLRILKTKSEETIITVQARTREETSFREERLTFQKRQELSLTATDTRERLGFISLYVFKKTDRTCYVTLDPKVIKTYGIQAGDILKLKLIEVRKHREHAPVEEESSL
jgi:hypothetical protein